MNKAALLAVGAVVGVAWYVRQKRLTVSDIGAALNQGGEFMEKQIEDAASALESAFGFIRVSNQAKVNQGLVDHPNVRAMLRVIRQGESSQDDSIAYRMIVGGKMFSSFADHPRIVGKTWIDKKGQRQYSTAAGAYQITKTTWDEVRVKMGLKDFSPRSQDIAALGRMAYRGALPDVVRGDVVSAIKKLREEWTSIPGAKENNSAAGNMENAKRLFSAWGGYPSIYA